MALQTLTIRRPDDWHVHLRDGEMLQAVAPYTARQFARAIVMPNLAPPVTTVEAATAYRERIVAAAGAGLHAADDLLSDRRCDPGRNRARVRGRACGSRPSSIRRARPPTAPAGVTDIRNIYPALERMQRIGMVLCVHGEVTDPEVDVFDREAVFIDRVLEPLVARLSRRSRSCSSISPPRRRPSSSQCRGQCRGDHHAAASHHQPQCLVRRRPEAARLLPAGRQARGASAGGAQGGDLGLAQILPRHRQRAAHARGQGIGVRLRRHLQRAVRARELCQVFDEEDALDRFEAFASEHGPRFYGLPLNEGTVTLERAEVVVPDEIDGVVPFHAGETLRWRMVVAEGD